MPKLPVSEIMTTKLRMMHEDDAVSIADWLMNLDEIHHVLIVDAERKLVGILSDRDILRVANREDRVEVGAIMSPPTHTVTPSTSVAQALSVMMDAKVHALPVVDDTGQPVGIVTSTDFLEVARWALHGLDSRAPHAKVERSSM